MTSLAREIGGPMIPGTLKASKDYLEFLRGFSARQKAHLLQNNMTIAVTILKPVQRAAMRQLFADYDLDGTKEDNVPVFQSPDTTLTDDFAFKVYATRIVNGQKENFAAYIARPYDVYKRG